MKRTLTYAWLSFRRNGWLSTATVLVMMLTLFVIGGLLLLSVVTNTVLTNLENQIDISVAFKKGVKETEVLAVQRQIEAQPNIREIRYVSAAEALEEFKHTNANDPTILAALEELGDENPLPARIDVKANNSSDLSSIAQFLEDKKFSSVGKINYFENQKVIERLNSIIRGVRSFGVGIILILGFVATLVAFTTIRLAIYTSREEITIMKLVGATNWYIRGPFLVNGFLYGAIAATITALLFFPVVWIVSPSLLVFLQSLNLQTYFVKNFLEFFSILLTIGVVLGVGSSLIAIRRYLKI